MEARADPLRVLILHRMGHPDHAPRFLPRHVASFARTHPESVCIVHDVHLPLPAYVRDAECDLVLLDVTLLGARWRGDEARQRLLAELAFLRDCDAVKIAFPQDEYDCHEVLDDWLCDWRVDGVFSVIDGPRDVLYPRYHRAGRFELGFTAYLDDELLSRAQRPWAGRPTDLGYRAKKLPPYFGRLGQVKWTIGRDVLARAAGCGLSMDIAVGDHAAIPGGAWLEFVESCRFMLGANSGSSLLDPRGDIQTRVRECVRRRPHATFDEIEQECFAGLDGRHEFTAIAPRNLEAAMLGTGQILVDGPYSGILRANEHYIPLRADASNFAEVQERMRDAIEVPEMIARCKATIAGEVRLTHAHRDARVARVVALCQRRRPREGSRWRDARDRYEREMSGAYRALWKTLEREASARRWIATAPPLVQSLGRALARRFRR